MSKINNGLNVGTQTGNVCVKIPKKMPKKTIVWGKKKDYVWIPMDFNFGEQDNA